MNVDETSVCLFQGTAKGTVMARKRKFNDATANDGPREPAQKVNRNTRRTCLTHVAFVCDRPDTQRLLPQMVIGSEHTLTARDWPALLGRAPRNVYIVRQKSAWNNYELVAGQGDCSLVRLQSAGCCERLAVEKMN